MKSTRHFPFRSKSISHKSRSFLLRLFGCTNPTAEQPTTITNPKRWSSTYQRAWHRLDCIMVIIGKGEWQRHTFRTCIKLVEFAYDMETSIYFYGMRRVVVSHFPTDIILCVLLNITVWSISVAYVLCMVEAVHIWFALCSLSLVLSPLWKCTHRLYRESENGSNEWKRAVCSLIYCFLMLFDSFLFAFVAGNQWE